MKQNIFQLSHKKAITLLVTSIIVFFLFGLVQIPSLGLSMYGGKVGRIDISFNVNDLVYGIFFLLVCTFLLKIRFLQRIKGLGKFTIFGGSFILLVFYNIYLTKKNPFSYSFGTGMASLFFCLISGIVVGWFEEMLFRGGIFMSLRSLLKSHQILAMILANVIFSCAHFTNFQYQGFWDTVNQIYFAFCIGILFSVLYLASKNLLVPVLIHGLVDASDNFSKAIYSGPQSSGIDWIVVTISVIFLINAYYIYQKYAKS